MRLNSGGGRRARPRRVVKGRCALREQPKLDTQRRATAPHAAGQPPSPSRSGVDALTPSPQANTKRRPTNVDTYAHPVFPPQVLFTVSVSSVLTKMGAKALINSHPKKFGKGGRRCRVCGNQQPSSANTT